MLTTSRKLSFAYHPVSCIYGGSDSNPTVGCPAHFVIIFEAIQTESSQSRFGLNPASVVLDHPSRILGFALMLPLV